MWVRRRAIWHVDATPAQLFEENPTAEQRICYAETLITVLGNVFAWGKDPMVVVGSTGSPRA